VTPRARTDRFGATPRGALAAVVLATLIWALPPGRVRAQEAALAAPADATRPAPATPGNLSREEKRCNAGLRRVERHRMKLAETTRAVEANRKTAEACGSRRACDQASHRDKTLGARARREERQLAQLEAEAKKLCATASSPAGPR